MIKIERAVCPTVLANNQADWLQDLLAADEALDEAERLFGKKSPQATKACKDVKKIESKYKQKTIKDALTGMCHDKCVYCEKTVEYREADIEHFYPKSIYRDKTFLWENLFLACPSCNRFQKVDYDPQDPPRIIDPCQAGWQSDQDLEFNIVRQFIHGEMKILAIVDGSSIRGQSSVDLFDLNGKNGRGELVKMRNRRVGLLYELFEMAVEGDVRARGYLQQACHPDYEFSAFAISLTARLH